MPGDPHRSRFIAETFLDGAKLIHDIRGVQAYSGTYLGTPVSVMASGMGMPSMGIYSYELYQTFGVENILRVGTCGAMQKDIPLRTVILGMAACTDSNYMFQYHMKGTFAPICDYTLLETAAAQAREMKLNLRVGNLLSTDVFYYDDFSDNDPWMKMGVLAVEMESAALYCNAIRMGKRALTICTVSDSLVTGEKATVEERQTSYLEMMELALRTAKQMDGKK
jgi:purine-nucleoside phosphorylase